MGGLPHCTPNLNFETFQLWILEGLSYCTLLSNSLACIFIPSTEGQRKRRSWGCKSKLQTKNSRAGCNVLELLKFWGEMSQNSKFGCNVPELPKFRSEKCIYRFLLIWFSLFTYAIRFSGTAMQWFAMLIRLLMLPQLELYLASEFLRMSPLVVYLFSFPTIGFYFCRLRLILSECTTYKYHIKDYQHISGYEVPLNLSHRFT